MNRRQFLASLGIGAPAAVLAAKAGLLERVRSYFFAPKGGWLERVPYPGRLCTPYITPEIFFDSPRTGVLITKIESPAIMALQYEALRTHLADTMQHDAIFFEKIRRSTSC